MTTIRTTPALLATLLAALLCAPPASAAPSERHISVRAGSRRVRATLLTRHQLNQFAGDKTPLIAETTKALQRKNSKGTKRGFHGAPALGTAVVSLDPHAGIDKGLRDMLARGIFGDAQKGFMRFSTGNPNAKEVPQWVPDVRGIGIALPEVIAISQREGAYMMAVAFVYTPAAFIAAAVVGLVVWNARRKPSEKQAALHADADMR